jgi:hypothetical protein
MKPALTIILVLIFITQSCNNVDTVPDKQHLNITDEKESTEANYLDLTPMDTIDGKLVFEINGFHITSSLNWAIQESNGPDFSVTSFRSEDGNRFSCYFGSYPSYPEPIQWQMSKWSDQSVQNELLNSGYYKDIVQVSIENGINADSSIVYVTDSMYLEVYKLESKGIWIRKPLDGRTGSIDIAVDFHADSIPTMLHFMGESKTTNDSKRLIELAKSVEKL